ncbi:pyridoxamine 5'-phosphate oxidase family protein [uncultured Winogradskyella sp.]|uniref:pyridoxamine 5'-phosphate oxidase family protein n=1 Tax=uncultured Winogradskyella sp. TaxID=395353 RepID=UPI0035187625
MKQEFLDKIKRELINGYAKKRHPFRYFTLATMHNGAPRQRTVILRKLQDDFTLVLYTDSRSQKVADIKECPTVSALFYHPKKLIQVKVEGNAEIVSDKSHLDSYWKSIPENSKKDYITKLPPGSPIDNPDHTTYYTDKNYFCMIKIIPNTIEILQLKRPNHMRALYTNTTVGWQGQFIVP